MSRRMHLKNILFERHISKKDLLWSCAQSINESSQTEEILIDLKSLKAIARYKSVLSLFQSILANQ